MDRMRIGAALVIVVLVAGCARPGTTAAGHEDCPPVQREGNAAVDYVDFIQAFGQNYVAGLASRPIAVRPSELGRVVIRSRCSLSALNDRTHMAPGPARDGDTAFLPPGTPIYAINGWSPRCRLGARSTGAGRLVAYLAMQPNARHATPRRCAVHR